MTDSISQLYSIFPPHLREATPAVKGRILQSTAAYVGELQGHVRTLLGILADHNIDIHQLVGEEVAQSMLASSNGNDRLRTRASAIARTKRGVWPCRRLRPRVRA